MQRPVLARTFPNRAVPIANIRSGGRLYTNFVLHEDFQAGRKFGDLTVVNLFLTGPEDFDFEQAP